MIDNVRDHIEKLHLRFIDPKNQAFLDELASFHADLVASLAHFDISSPSQRDLYLKRQGQLELVELWLKMPDQTAKYIKHLADAVSKAKNLLSF